MGRFEDLVEQAKTGDNDALDTLLAEFSGSTLRQQAEEGSAFKTRYEKILPLVRKTRLDDLVAKLDDDLREVGLDVTDFGDFDPDNLSLEQVIDKAKTKSETVQATRLAAAKDAGFDTVEEYQQALQAVKDQREKRKQGMEKVGAGVISAGGGEPGGGEEESLFDKGQAAFKSAREQGRATDYAMATAIEAILTAQAPAEET